MPKFILEIEHENLESILDVCSKTFQEHIVGGWKALIEQTNEMEGDEASVSFVAEEGKGAKVTYVINGLLG